MVYIKRDKRRSDLPRNIFLCLLGAATLWLFFHYGPLVSGDSIFTRSADKRLAFAGDLKTKDYTAKEKAALIRIIKRYKDTISQLTVRTALQDSYATIGPTTPIIYELRIRTEDGASIDSTTSRAPRSGLVQAVLSRLRKDMEGYEALKRQGKNVESLVNTQ